MCRIFAPNIFGWLADRSGERVKWVRITSFFGVLGFVGIFWANTFYSIFFVMMAMSIFTSSTLPLAESLTLSHLEANKANSDYSRIRLWGSLGFIFASLVLGFFIDNSGAKSLIYGLLIAQIIIFLLSFVIPDKVIMLQEGKKRSIWGVLKKTEVIILLTGCALMVSSHGLLYNFYSIFLQEQGYSNTIIGILWSIGVVFEILIFIMMPMILKKITLKSVLLISLLFAVVRFFLIGSFADSLPILIFAQIMHAATFGSFHVASIQLISNFFNNEHQARGQSLYNSVTYGVGGTIGGLGGGYLIDYWGTANTFVFSATLPLLGFIIIYLGLSDKIKATLD